MKIDKFALICAVTLGAALSAEDKKPEPPKPIATALSADEKATFGATVSALLNLRLHRETLERKAIEEVSGLAEARKQVAAQEKEFNQKLADLQKKHNAPGCMVTLEYEWINQNGEPCGGKPPNATAKK